MQMKKKVTRREDNLSKRFSPFLSEPDSLHIPDTACKRCSKTFSSQMERALKLYSLDPEKNSLSKCGVINYALPDVEAKCIYCPATLLQLHRWNLGTVPLDNQGLETSPLWDRGRVVRLQTQTLASSCHATHALTLHPERSKNSIEKLR